jgi:hypothetical protein
MKKNGFLMGILSMVLVFGMAMFVGCKADDDDGGGGGSSNKATVKIINDSSSTVNIGWVKVSTMYNSIMEDTSPNIAPGTDKSFDVPLSEDTACLIYAGESNVVQHYSNANKTLHIGETYTFRYKSGGTIGGTLTME